jgi:hypothetical protein
MGTLLTFDEFTSGGRPQGGTIRELVMSEVTNLIAKDRPLLSNLESMPVTNTFVESLEDTLRSRGFNAVLEGATATDPNLTQAVRLFAHTQLFGEWGIVSDTQRRVGHYNEDPFVYQSRKSLEQLLNDVEHAFHRGSAASGETDVVRQTAGMLNIATSTTLTDSSGTTMTEEVFIDLLQVWADNNFDFNPSQAYVNSYLKRTISEYSTRVTRNVNASEKMQVLQVEQHSSDFGDVFIHYSRDQLKSTSKTTAGNSIIFIDPSFFKKGWLQPPTLEQLPRDGFRDRYQIQADVGLIFKTDKAVGGATGLVAHITQQ